MTSTDFRDHMTSQSARLASAFDTVRVEHAGRSYQWTRVLAAIRSIPAGEEVRAMLHPKHRLSTAPEFWAAFVVAAPTDLVTTVLEAV